MVIPPENASQRDNKRTTVRQAAKNKVCLKITALRSAKEHGGADLGDQTGSRASKCEILSQHVIRRGI